MPQLQPTFFNEGLRFCRERKIKTFISIYMKSLVKIFLLCASALLFLTFYVQGQTKALPWKGKLIKQITILHDYQSKQKVMRATSDPVQSNIRLGAVHIPGFITHISHDGTHMSYSCQRYTINHSSAMKNIAAELKAQKFYRVYDSNNPAHTHFFTDEYGLIDGDIRIIRLVDKKGMNIAFITEREDRITIDFE